MNYVVLLAAYPQAVRDQVEKFVRFAALLGVTIEEFQRLIVAELFSGVRELIVLLPRGNGKTSLFSLIALWHLLKTQAPSVYAAAATHKQASILFREATTFAHAHPAVEKAVAFKWDHLQANRGRFEVIAADKSGSQHGLMPSLALVDELHAHKKADTYVALRSALMKKPGSQMVVISTAGLSPSGPLWELRQQALRFDAVTKTEHFVHTRSPNGKVAFLEWALPQDTDPMALTVDLLRSVNPASFVADDFLAEQLEAPGLRPTEIAALHANLWASAEQTWLPYGAWDDCAEPGASIPDHASVWLGVDIGFTNDTSSIVTAWRRDDGKVVVNAKVLQPAHGREVEIADVEQAIRDLASRYRVIGCHYDPWNFMGSAQRLSSEGMLMVKFPFTNARTAPASQALMEAIKRGELVHDGDPLFAAHVNAGVPHQTERGWRLKKNTLHIDALMALMIAYDGFSVKTTAPSVYQSRPLLVL